MNPLNSITYHLNGLEEAYAKIKTDQTRGKAETAMMEVYRKIFPPVVPDIITTTTILPPVEALPAEPEIVTPPPDQPTEVKLVGGWPMEGKLTVVGLASNRRSLRARLEDGRGVCMERHFKAWKVGDTVRAKLIRAGAAPLYRVV